MYWLRSKNKGADQLCSYCTADLHLCFRIDKSLVCLRRAHLFFSFQELADLKKSDMKSFRNIIVDERNILMWQGLIVPVGRGVLYEKTCPCNIQRFFNCKNLNFH